MKKVKKVKKIKRADLKKIKGGAYPKNEVLKPKAPKQ
jgi:hypothetical protein